MVGRICETGEFYEPVMQKWKPKGVTVGVNGKSIEDPT